MVKPDDTDETLTDNPVADYKLILAEVLERRPSGTRGRLASSLGKNRSFISHITSGAYSTPIPVGHIDVIFEVCHFSADERRRFLADYARAHPRRPVLLAETHRLKSHTFQLPDLGDPARNEKLHSLVSDFMLKLAHLLTDV
jgi:hypothetical protein